MQYCTSICLEFEGGTLPVQTLPDLFIRFWGGGQIEFCAGGRWEVRMHLTNRSIEKGVKLKLK